MDESVPSHITKKEKFLFHNNLVCLVKALEKRCITIDLRNETSLTGKLLEVDGFMNVILKDAAFFDTDGNYRYFELLHIQARNIRMVHIPSDISIKKTLKDQVMETNKPVKNKKLTFKQSRAKKQQKETLELIKQMKEKKALSELEDKSSN